MAWRGRRTPSTRPRERLGRARDSIDGAEGASRDAAAARRDDRARKRVAAVHANPKTLARAPELDAADVRSEVLFRVLRRHARLDRVASYLNVVLGVQTCVEINQ